jgi:hypothetical protein
MDQINDKWSKTVFRLRGLPNYTDKHEEVSTLLCEWVGDIPRDCVRVFSLATSLNHWEAPPSKVATVMFTMLPAIIRDNLDEVEWPIVSPSKHSHHDLVLDIHFMGMTPLNDLEKSLHQHE